jgi:hypothetical protein
VVPNTGFIILFSSIGKRVKEGKREWEFPLGSEFVQGILCTCMELSQRNPLRLLMYDK